LESGYRCWCTWLKSEYISFGWTACWLALEACQYIQLRMREHISDVVHGARLPLDAKTKSLANKQENWVRFPASELRWKMWLLFFKKDKKTSKESNLVFPFKVSVHRSLPYVGIPSSLPMGRVWIY
jgi:hypothetical protein